MSLKRFTKFKRKLTRGLKYTLTNLLNFHLSSQKSGKLLFDRLFMFRAYKDLDEKSTEESCLIILKSDAKFEEKLTLGFKIDMKKLVNFNASNSKSESLHFDGLLL